MENTWRAEKRSDGTWSVIEDDFSRSILGVVVCEGLREEDARFLSAAPDLLTACEHGLRVLEYGILTMPTVLYETACESAKLQLSAAIAKSQGK